MNPEAERHDNGCRIARRYVRVRRGPGRLRADPKRQRPPARDGIRHSNTEPRGDRQVSITTVTRIEVRCDRCSEECWENGTAQWPSIEQAYAELAHEGWQIDDG